MTRPGMPGNLERFDTRLGEWWLAAASTDMLIVTADHGNDPTTPSTDHSREHVPLIAARRFGPPSISARARPSPIWPDAGGSLCAAASAWHDFLRELV